MRSALLALASLAALSACEDPPETAYGDFQASARGAICERALRCGLVEELAICELRPRVDVDLDAAVAMGIVRYDGAAAHACHAQLAALTCDTSARDARILPAACDAMFAGTLAAGEPCAFAEECASGACDITGCDAQCCAGTCHGPRFERAVGEACAVDDDCAAIAFCATTSVCEPLGAEADSCRSDRQCDVGLGCIGATFDAPGSCRRLPLLGEACPFQRCAELGAVCAGTCVPAGLTAGRCTTSAECSTFYECRDSQCAPLPRLGQPCTLRCAGDAWCDQDRGQCSAPGAELEPCSADDQCESQFCEEGPVFEACAIRSPCL